MGNDTEALSSLVGTEAAALLLRNHVVALRPFTSGQIPDNTTVVDTASPDPDDTLTIVKSK